MSQGEQLLAQLPKDAGSSCILLDIRIPGVSGPKLQGRLNEMGIAPPDQLLSDGSWRYLDDGAGH